MNQTWENNKTRSFGPDFDRFGPNSGCQFFFSRIWLCQSLDVISDGQTDRTTDGQTDKSDFIRRYPTNFECPIANKSHCASQIFWFYA